MDVHVFHPLRRIHGRKDQPQATGNMFRDRYRIGTAITQILRSMIVPQSHTSAGSPRVICLPQYHAAARVALVAPHTNLPAHVMQEPDIPGYHIPQSQTTPDPACLPDRGAMPGRRVARGVVRGSHSANASRPPALARQIKL